MTDMGNLLVTMAGLMTAVPLYVYGRCRRFFQSANRPRPRITGALLMAAVLLASAVAGYAAGNSGSHETLKVRVPRTVGEHRAAAQRYRLKAMDYERDAKTHQLICDAYDFNVSIPENPMVAGPSLMEAKKRCERYVRDAVNLAGNARALADYHAARAKILGGP